MVFSTAAILPGGGLLGGAISGIFSYKGMKAQAAENAKINQMSLAAAAADRKLTREQMAIQEKQNKQALKYQKEKDRADRKISIANNMHSYLMRNPQAAIRLIEIQKTRRAA